MVLVMVSNAFPTLAFLLLVALLMGCTGTGQGQVVSDSEAEAETEAVAGLPASDTAALPSSLSLWMSAELKDVATGEAFSIAGFNGRPVLMESFAVWCPVCTRQQQEIKKLHEQVGDAVVSVSIDTDPNEDEARVREHTEKNGFDWYYAVSPKAVTDSLVEDFGLSFLNAPIAPMAVVCPDQSKSTHRLRNGVKSADELISSVSELCA